MTRRYAPFLKPVPGGMPFSNAWVLLATVGGIGLWRWGPGTAASLAALPLAWLVLGIGGMTALLFATIAVSVLGVPAGDYVETHGGGKDPGSVVIDEVAGQWLTLWLTLAILTGLPNIDGPVVEGAAGPVGLALSFAAFRLFDITKPWPCSWADRRMQGGLGIMADDLIAAVYAGVAVAMIYVLVPALHSA